MPNPVVVRPEVPVRAELIVAVWLLATLMKGVVPARLMVPLFKVPPVVKVRPLAYTVALTVALSEARLKTALLLRPFVESHGVPETPVQLVLVVFHVPLVAPDQVAVEAWAAVGRSAHVSSAPMEQARADPGA